MRWDHLFDDLSGQGAASELADLAVEVSDRSRHAAGQASLVVRLRGWPRPAPLTLGLPSQQRITGLLVAVGTDWVVVQQQGEDCLVPVAAVRWIEPAPPLLPVPPRPAAGAVVAGLVQDRLGLTHAVRLLARDRTLVRVSSVDGEAVTGTIDRVGPDHLQVAQHPDDEPRRTSAVRATRWIPFAAVAAIRGGQVWSDS